MRQKRIWLVCFLLAGVLGMGIFKWLSGGKRDGEGQNPSGSVKFIMPIDDVFATKPGGVVVTGVINSGVVRSGDALQLSGMNKAWPVTVKGVETFNSENQQFVSLDQASKGQRVGVWVLGVEKDQISKGDLLGSRPSPVSDSRKPTTPKNSTFNLVKGCEANNLRGVHEGYSIADAKGYKAFTINVSAEHIADVFMRLTKLPKEPVFFLIEVGTHADEEAKLRKNETDPFHKDVYYLDGLSLEKARQIFQRYKDLLVDDGGVTFGIGSHDSKDEVFVGAYKIFEVYAVDPQKYETALRELGFRQEPKIKTVWQTFTKDSPGKRNVLTDRKPGIWDMIEELKKEGLYLTERRVG